MLNCRENPQNKPKGRHRGPASHRIQIQVLVFCWNRSVLSALLQYWTLLFMRGMCVCESETFFCLGVTRLSLRKLKYMTTGNLSPSQTDTGAPDKWDLPRGFHVAAELSVLVFTRSLFLLWFPLLELTVSTKAAARHCYFFTCLKTGEADLLFVIRLVISAEASTPKACGTNIFWIVSYVPELWTYLTFLVVSGRKIGFCERSWSFGFTETRRCFVIPRPVSLTDRDTVKPEWLEQFMS